MKYQIIKRYYQSINSLIQHMRRMGTTHPDYKYCWEQLKDLRNELNFLRRTLEPK